MNERQRQSILERDSRTCQFTACPLRANGNSARVSCTPNKLNVHHLIPQRYSELFGIDPNYPENLLTVCEGAHIKSDEGIHPDMAQALRNYHQNPDGIKEVFANREKLLEEHKPYWNTKYDRTMSVQAVRNTQLKKKEGWEFPHVVYQAKK